MTRQCMLTGKSPRSGNNRPFSLKITKRRFLPNLFWKKIFNPMTQKFERVRLSAKAIRTLKKWAREGEAMARVSDASVKETTSDSKKERVKKEKLTPKQKKEIKIEAEAKKKSEIAPKTIPPSVEQSNDGEK